MPEATEVLNAMEASLQDEHGMEVSAFDLQCEGAEYVEDIWELKRGQDLPTISQSGSNSALFKTEKGGEL
eukprot:3486817-Amphidinium_carterae.2